MDLPEKVHRLVTHTMRGQEVGEGQGQIQLSTGESGKVMGRTERTKVAADLIRKSLRKPQG